MGRSEGQGYGPDGVSASAPSGSRLGKSVEIGFRILPGWDVACQLLVGTRQPAAEQLEIGSLWYAHVQIVNAWPADLLET